MYIKEFEATRLTCDQDKMSREVEKMKKIIEEKDQKIQLAESMLL